MTFSGPRGAHRTLAHLTPICCRQHFSTLDPETRDFSTSCPRVSLADPASAAAPLALALHSLALDEAQIGPQDATALAEAL